MAQMPQTSPPSNPSHHAPVATNSSTSSSPILSTHSDVFDDSAPSYKDIVMSDGWRVVRKRKEHPISSRTPATRPSPRLISSHHSSPSPPSPSSSKPSSSPLIHTSSQPLSSDSPSLPFRSRSRSPSASRNPDLKEHDLSLDNSFSVLAQGDVSPLSHEV